MLRLSVLAVVFAALPVAAQEVWYPNLWMWPSLMSNHAYDTTKISGRLLYRFDSAIVNLGPGELQLSKREEDAGNGRFEVDQVVYRSDDSSFRRDAGGFKYNPDTTRMEATGWIAYRIRRILANDEVGEALREGGKTVVNITSSLPYDLTIENAVGPLERMTGGGPTHGISVGWYDYYQLGLDFQWIDITGLPRGEYWLEVEIDPANHVDEADETDNVTRIKVTLDNANMPMVQGDVNLDNVVNAVDVQTVINEALGLSTSVFSSDLNGDGPIDAVDVQLAVNAALGLLEDAV